MKHKKVAGIFLLFCLVMPIGITYTFMHYRKIQVRKEVKRQIVAGIDKEDLVLLKFSDKELNRLHWKHSKEFELEGKMYDVVEKQAVGDSTYYWCWLDNEETTLCKQLDDLLKYTLGKDPRKRENQKQLSNFHNSLYCEDASSWCFFQFEPEKLDSRYSFNSTTVLFPPPVPPPEFC